MGRQTKKRRFECKVDGHMKFWEAQVITLEMNDGAMYVVQRKWGRIGTEGQQQTKEFGTMYDAEDEMYRLIRQKTGNRDYIEVPTVD